MLKCHRDNIKADSRAQQNSEPNLVFTAGQDNNLLFQPRWESSRYMLGRHICISSYTNYSS